MQPVGYHVPILTSRLHCKLLVRSLIHDRKFPLTSPSIGFSFNRILYSYSWRNFIRVVAILASYNEERFIAACLEHLFQQGIEAYLIDDSSTDDTVRIAERYLKKGLIGIESFPRTEFYVWKPILERKEQLAHMLDADWLMHADPDEIRLPPRSNQTLAEAFSEADAQGYNAVNFQEFTFVPTQEAPDHDHPEYQRTMRSYYPFLPSFPHQLKAWKQQLERVELAWSGGHKVRFANLRMYHTSFPMRHYQFLSVPHAQRMYGVKKVDRDELEAGWHGWRNQLSTEMIKLPSQAELRTYISDDHLDASNPRTRHLIEECVAPRWKNRILSRLRRTN